MELKKYSSEAEDTVRFEHNNTIEEDAAPSNPQQLANQITTQNISHNPISIFQSEQRVSKFREAVPQVLATSAQNLLMIAYGMTIGFPTIVIPHLQDGSEINLHLTDNQISWVASISQIVVPVGCLASGVLTNRLGRKSCMLLVNVPLLIAWLMLYHVQSVTIFYLALAITGLSGGLLEAPVLTYVAEITTPALRGFLSTSSCMCVTLGIFSQGVDMIHICNVVNIPLFFFFAFLVMLFYIALGVPSETSLPGSLGVASVKPGFVLANFLVWRTIVMINVALPIVTFVSLLLVPESPYWLAGKERHNDARKNLAWLRGWVPVEVINREYTELLNTVNASEKDSSGTTTTRNDSYLIHLKRALRPYLRAPFVKPFLLVSAIFFFCHFSGATTLQTYAISIFQHFRVPIDAYLATLILGLIALAGTFLGVVAVHWTGKRPLTLTSVVGAGLCFLSVTIYDHCVESEGTSTISVIPLMFLIISSFLTNMGIRLLPWILIGEVFPSEVRGIASGLASTVGYICNFLANKTHLMLVNSLALKGTLFLYVCINMTAALVLYFKLPETEGRTLLEIYMYFAGRKQLDDYNNCEVTAKNDDGSSIELPAPMEKEIRSTKDVENLNLR